MAPLVSSLTSVLDAVDGSSAGIAMCHICSAVRSRMGGAIHGSTTNGKSRYVVQFFIRCRKMQ